MGRHVCISCHSSHRLPESMPARATAATVLPHADTGTSRRRWCCEHALIDCSLRGMASLLASISKKLLAALRGLPLACAAGMPQSALAAALATVLLGATAARAMVHGAARLWGCGGQ